MRTLVSFFAMALVGVMVGLVFTLAVQQEKAQTVPQQSPAQLRAHGMTWSPFEVTQYLGPFPLTSAGVWKLGNTRRVTFQADGGRHYEELVTCDRPRIENGRVYVYSRTSKVAWDVRKRQWQITYYVVCVAEVPLDNTRNTPSG